MAVMGMRRRRRCNAPLVRGAALLGVLLLVPLALFYPATALFRGIARLTQPAGAGEGSLVVTGSYLKEGVRLGGQIGRVGARLLRPRGNVTNSGRGKACLPLTWTGNSHDYNLTREAAACIADADGVLMVTWANWHYADFVRNWVDHVRDAGAANFLVGAMDSQLLQALAADGVPTFNMESGLTTSDFGWGSATFHKMGRKKIGLINTFTSWGLDILVSDVDTMWMRNPLPYMAEYPQADVLTSSDHLRAEATDGGLEFFPEAGSAANIGIMLIRRTAVELTKEWLEKIQMDEKYWDQHAFNDLMLRNAVTAPRREDRLFLGYDGRLKIGILPVSMFCSGHTFFVQRMPEKLGLDAYVAHATYQYSGTPGKRNRFREALLWNDPPEYFEREGGFLAYTPDIPSEMLRAATPPDRDHPPQTREHIAPQFTLMHHQLAQLRTAWAIAQTLRRALVLPQLWSGQDRYWAPHNGRLPGSALELPFLAPADHIIELEGMAEPRAEATFGPMIEWREHSFLHNKRLPPEVKRSRVRVVICKPQDDQGPCSDGSRAAEEIRGRVHLQPDLNDQQLRTALQPFAGRRIMMFDTMLNAFSGFNNTAVADRFENRLKHYGGVFCCIDEQPHGNAFYDFFFDKPHTDRFGRQFESWELRMGP